MDLLSRGLFPPSPQSGLDKPPGILSLTPPNPPPPNHYIVGAAMNKTVAAADANRNSPNFANLKRAKASW